MKKRKKNLHKKTAFEIKTVRKAEVSPIFDPNFDWVKHWELIVKKKTTVST